MTKQERIQIKERNKQDFENCCSKLSVKFPSNVTFVSEDDELFNVKAIFKNNLKTRVRITDELFYDKERNCVYPDASAEKELVAMLNDELSSF